jgi:hypothetical protein
MKLRFIGNGESYFGGVLLNRLGQVIDVPEQDAKEIVTGNGPYTGWAGSIAMIPEERWHQTGITADEQKKFMYPGDRIGAPKEFTEKLHVAMGQLEEFRQEVEADRKDALMELNAGGSPVNEETE